MKVANSINRIAIPAGAFTGKSKQLYDTLYSLTRGAISPARTVRISRPKLMKRAHIGSRVTFDANVARLISVGLIGVKQIPGEHEGNEYTVYLPEEVDLNSPAPTSQTSHSSQTAQSGYALNIASPGSLETSHTRLAATDAVSTIYGDPKTFSKTFNTNDDELFSELIKRLRQAIVQITDSAPSFSPLERDRWGEVGRVLTEELIAAAGRSHLVSSVPAFFAEHLRRRFSRAPQEFSRAAITSDQPRPADNESSPAEIRPAELNDSEISDAAEMLGELLSRGEYSVETLTTQFSAGFTPESWNAVLAKAIELQQNRKA
jgi:hypothetical protein